MMNMNYEFCDGITHTVKKGDTLYEISRMHDVPLAMLLRANPYADVFNLQPGDTICVPASRTTQPENDVSGARPENAGQGTQPGNVVPRTPQGGAEQSVLPGNTSPAAPERAEERTEQPTEPGSRSVNRQSAEQEETACSGRWEKYVVKPGDTLADVMQEMSGDITAFLEKNGPEHVYLLPGAAYYICR